ncbi:MAG: NAD(+) synthase [Clostridia bacterium]|nr:NAD(+) synthase [Clostridia bacterium]
MNEYLKQYIGSLDVAALTRGLVGRIAGWFAENGPDSPAVIGISGGKDSTVCAALCAKALGRDRVVGVMMPNGIQPDIDVSLDVINCLGIRSAVVNIKGAYDALEAAVEGSGIRDSLSRQARINLAPRLRMASLYALSQTLNGRVSNNGNRSERYVGYMTVWGDTAGDFAPLAGLTVTEVRLVGRELGVPERFVGRPPSDGLTGLTDEENLGFTYEALDTYILTGHCPDPEVREKIDRMHARNLFKLSSPALLS